MRLLLVLVAVLIGVPAAAHSAPAPSLSLEDVVRSAWASDAALQALERRVAALKVAVPLVGAPPAASLRISAVTGISPEDANALTQILELGGQGASRRRAAAAVLASAQAALDARRLDVALDVGRLYAGVQNADGQADVAGQELAAQDALLILAQRRFQAGDVAQSQVVRAERERAHAQREATVASVRQQAAREALGLRIGSPLELQTVVVPQLPLVLPTESLAELIAEAARARADLRGMRADVEERQQQVRLSRAQGSPFLELQVYGTQFYGNNAQAGARATLNWPVFDWGQRRGAVEQAKATVEAARAQLATAEKDAAGQLQDALARWRSRAAERAALESGEVVAAQRLVDMLTRGYTLGAVTQLELIEARRTLIELRREALRLQAEEATAALDTWRALGRPLIRPDKLEVTP